MLNRRTALLAAAGAVGLQGKAFAQARARPRVGFANADPSLSAAVADELRRLGWPPDRIELLQAGPGAPIEELDALLARQLDVLVAPGALRIRHAAARTSIPIVGIDLESDPVESGFVRSLGRPGGKITGIWLDGPELAGKLVQQIRELIPGLRRLTILYDSRVGLPQFAAAQAAVLREGLESVPFPLVDPREAGGLLTLTPALGSEALIVLTSPAVYVIRSEIAAAALARGIPSVSILTDFARAGGLMAYGPSLRAMFRRSATYVDRILRGQAPGDLPVERPDTFELVINRTTADRLGLVLTPAILARADEIIE